MESGLEPHEEEILIRMLREGFVEGAYSSLERVARAIRWEEIARRCGVRAKFKSVAKRLVSRGLLTDHGKSMRVLSLTRDGVRVALALMELRRERDGP